MMHKSIKIGSIKTSRTEIVDILKAWLALSLAFTFLLYPRFYGSGISVLGGGFSVAKIFSIDFLILFIISLLTAGLGFLLHELGHKFVAQHYGCTAEFRAWDQLLYLAVGLAVFISFIFAAPGAVMISGMITRKENGHISLAGPLINYGLGLLFLCLMFIFPSGSLWHLVTATGFSVNVWLGIFNLIPFGPLDGRKVFDWNKAVWGAMLGIGLFAYFILPKII